MEDPAVYYIGWGFVAKTYLHAARVLLRLFKDDVATNNRVILAQL